jgi:hypothetical protein
MLQVQKLPAQLQVALTDQCYQLTASKASHLYVVYVEHLLHAAAAVPTPSSFAAHVICIMLYTPANRNTPTCSPITCSPTTCSPTYNTCIHNLLLRLGESASTCRYYYARHVQSGLDLLLVNMCSTIFCLSYCDTTCYTLLVLSQAKAGTVSAARVCVPVIMTH